MARPARGLLVVLMVTVVALPARAQYSPTAGAGRVTRSVLAACQCTVFSGAGFRPGAPVVVTDGGEFVGNTVAGRDGGFTLTVCFDGTTRPGAHTLVASGPDGTSGDREVRATARVSGSVCSTTREEVRDAAGGPPTRGARKLPPPGLLLVVPVLLTGFGLLTFGGVARRRRTLPL